MLLYNHYPESQSIHSNVVSTSNPQVRVFKYQLDFCVKKINRDNLINRLICLSLTQKEKARKGKERQSKKREYIIFQVTITITVLAYIIPCPLRLWRDPFANTWWFYLTLEHQKITVHFDYMHLQEAIWGPNISPEEEAVCPYKYSVLGVTLCAYMTIEMPINILSLPSISLRIRIS